MEEPHPRCGAAPPSRSRAVEEPWRRVVEEPRPHHRGAAPTPWCHAKGGAKLCLHGREIDRERELLLLLT
jgi:hypothetical protein